MRVLERVGEFGVERVVELGCVESEVVLPDWFEVEFSEEGLFGVMGFNCISKFCDFRFWEGICQLDRKYLIIHLLEGLFEAFDIAVIEWRGGEGRVQENASLVPSVGSLGEGLWSHYYVVVSQPAHLVGDVGLEALEVSLQVVNHPVHCPVLALLVACDETVEAREIHFDWRIMCVGCVVCIL